MGERVATGETKHTYTTKGVGLRPASGGRFIFFHEKISVIVRRRSLAVDRESVCVPLLPGPGAGASRDKWDLAPSVRLPNVSRGCGRSVSEPDCDVHGDDVDAALRGVVGVCPSFDVDVVRLRASRRCSPFSAFTLTLS